jgi:hypothetical protein
METAVYRLAAFPSWGAGRFPFLSFPDQHGLLNRWTFRIATDINRLFLVRLSYLNIFPCKEICCCTSFKGNAGLCRSACSPCHGHVSV